MAHPGMAGHGPDNEPQNVTIGGQGRPPHSRKRDSPFLPREGGWGVRFRKLASRRCLLLGPETKVTARRARSPPSRTHGLPLPSLRLCRIEAWHIRAWQAMGPTMNPTMSQLAGRDTRPTVGAAQRALCARRSARKHIRAWQAMGPTMKPKCHNWRAGTPTPQ